jgi:signal peptidase I
MNTIDQKGKELHMCSHSRPELKKLTKYCLGVGAFMAMGWWLTTYTQLLEVASESLEGVRYLIVLKSSSIKRGDIVSIQGHKPEYVGQLLFTKRVIGLPGDHVIRNKTQLTIKAQNGSFSMSLPLLTKTKEEEPLTPLSLNVIPKGTYFVIGDHLRSFDSRYEEFGLIPLEKIYGKAMLKW